MPEDFELLIGLSRCGDKEQMARYIDDHNARKKQITNADRIRAMNNYELAVFLAKVKALVYRADLPVIAYSTKDMAENLEWLGQPVED